MVVRIYSKYTKNDIPGIMFFKSTQILSNLLALEEAASRCAFRMCEGKKGWRCKTLVRLTGRITAY